MYDVVVKKFTFAVSSSDEFLVMFSSRSQGEWQTSRGGCPDLRATSLFQNAILVTVSQSRKVHMILCRWPWLDSVACVRQSVFQYLDRGRDVWRVSWRLINKPGNARARIVSVSEVHLRRSRSRCDGPTGSRDAIFISEHRLRCFGAGVGDEVCMCELYR